MHTKGKSLKVFTLNSILMPLEKPLELIQKRGAVDILVTLLNERKLNVSKLSEKAKVSNGTIQRRLDELKEKKLIREKIGKSENNRLEKAYSLTEMGQNLSETLISLREMSS